MDEFRIDSQKLMYHPRRVADRMEADTWEKAREVYPIYWEITTPAGGACNHRCSFCSVDAIGYKAGDLEVDTLIERIKEAKALGVKSVMFGGTGEPLVEKRICELIDAAHGVGLDIGITTNGVFLDRVENLNKCTWVKVSMNAGYPETYVKVHKAKLTDWDTVWSSIRRATKRRGNCVIGVQSLVLPENVNEMRGLANHCAQQPGISYLVLKPYSHGTFMLGTLYKGLTYDRWLSQLDSVKEFSTDEFKVVFRRNSMQQESKPHAYDRCYATPFFWMYSMADGRLFTCSAHLMDERFCIGNLKQHTVKYLWQSKARHDNWEMMKKFSVAKTCRLNCRMDKANGFVEQMLTQPHINFI